MSHEFHLSDRELLMAVDGELSVADAERAESHLVTCWACRARKLELENTIAEFVRFHGESFGQSVPPADGPRALLKAQLEQLADAERNSHPHWLRWMAHRGNWAAIAAVFLLATSVVMLIHSLPPRHSTRLLSVTVPDPSLTPGATVLVSEREVCREAGVKNKMVSVALQKRVFAEYGIGSIEPGAYEVDYLITPALGGADDIHNLWPQSSRETVWNAHVKDALEDHLRDLVCEGRLDLATAQREIAGNWIAAYKKYFHTEQPLGDSR